MKVWIVVQCVRESDNNGDRYELANLGVFDSESEAKRGADNLIQELKARGCDLPDDSWVWWEVEETEFNPSSMFINANKAYRFKMEDQ